MIGSDFLTFVRPRIYLYFGGSGTETLTHPLPTGGCYLRCEASDSEGSITINGVASDGSIAETISSFDANYISISLKKWISITSLIISGFTSLTIYPATSTGTKILLSDTDDIIIVGTLFSAARGSVNIGLITKDLGDFNINFKVFHYNPRLYTLQNKDRVTINNNVYEVKYINEITSEVSESILMTGRL